MPFKLSSIKLRMNNKRSMPTPKGKNNPFSKEIEIYKNGILMKTVKGVCELSRNSEKELGVFVKREILTYYIKKEKEINGFVLKFKDAYIF
jgi:hypothetical protein